MSATDVPSPAVRGVGRLPLWGHALMALVVVGAFVLVTRPGPALTSDEGAALSQARILDDTGTWYYRYPLDWLERAEVARPFVRGDAGSKGLAPYAKHVAYPVLIRAAGSGTAGALFLSVVGTVAAAWSAGLLARRMAAGPALAALTLWATAVATPLLFDAALALAHSLAAAAFGAATLASLRALESRGRSGAAWAVAAGATAGAATALRTEAILVVLVLAVAVVAVARSRWSGFVAIMLGAGGAAAVLMDRTVLRLIVGSPEPGPGNTLTSGLQGRWDGFYVTWLSSSYGPRSLAGSLLWVALATLAIAVVLLRRGRIGPVAFAWVSGLAAAAYVVRLVLDPAVVVPGLLLTVPVLWAAAWFVRPRPHDLAWVVCVLVSVGGALAILATQYSIGGGVEWGGRYFAVLLPPAVAVIVAGAAGDVGSLLARRPVALAVGASAAAATVAVALLAGVTLSQAHQRAEQLSDRIAVAAASVPSGADGRAVVLTTNRLLPQLLSADLDRYGWVSADASELPGFAAQLSGSGVGPVVLVAPGAETVVATLEGWTIRSIVRSSTYDVVVIEPEES